MDNHTSHWHNMFLFSESGTDYAINTNKIHDVINYPHPLLLPSPQPNCQGSLYINGSLIPLFPYCEKETTDTPNTKYLRSTILIRAFHHQKKQLVAFKADHIKGFAQICQTSVFSRHDWPSIQIPSFATGLFSHRNRITYIIDPNLLISNTLPDHCNGNELETFSEHMNN